jgi:hypothetical protein
MVSIDEAMMKNSKQRLREVQLICMNKEALCTRASVCDIIII